MAGKAVAAIGPLSRDRRGAFAAMTAVIAPVMIGMTALSVDLGVWYLESNRLKTAADAAAVGAAYLLRSGSATAPYQAAALAEAKNATSSGYLIGTLQTPVVTVSSDLKTVTVTLTSKADGFFSRLFGSVPTMSATAKAGLKQQNSACVLALNQTISSAIKVDNMGSIVASGCGIFSDSSASDAISLNCGTVSGTSLGTVGGYYQSTCGNNTWSPGTPTTKASSIADPYAGKTAPTMPASCGGKSYTYDFTAWASNPYSFTQTNSVQLAQTNSSNVYGNVFCGNVTIGGNGSTDTFAPGIYYIYNGNLTFNNANITSANGVTFVLTGTSPGSFNWTNYSNTTTLSAPTTGDTAGITVWQTGSTASGSTNTITTDAFNGGSTLQLGGAFYAPYGSLNLSNNIKMSATAVIADMISATGSASLSVSASSSTSTPTTSTPIVLLQ